MKRKLLILILTLALVFSLFGCGEKYPPVESTEEEMKTVMTLSVDGERYDVPYELYRAFFLQHKSAVDKGDSSVWESSEKEKYIEEINEIIISGIADIYSVFHIAKKEGIDLYSDENEEILNDYITASVEGGTVDSVYFEGFGGDYDAYLASLKQMNMNYSVQKTLLRYSLASTLLDFHYIGDEMNEGALEYTREDVLEFYNSDDSARFIKGYFSTSNEVFSLEKIQDLRYRVSICSSAEEAAAKIIQNSLAVGKEVSDGDLIGRYSLDPMYYSELTEKVFALEIGETAELIKVTHGMDEGYYIIYKAEKTDGHFEECYDYIEGIYLDHVIGKKIADVKADICRDIVMTDFYEELDHSSISID